MGRHGRSRPVIHKNGFTINDCRFNVDPKYQPIGAIGQGSYGVVCSVRNTQTHEKLAIKKITSMADDQWDATHTLREIRLMRWLGAHENIVSLKDLSMCKEKGELYMMMELADTDLHNLIQSSCLLTEDHVRVIMYQVLSGVKAMHDNGILHRDLKPGNLLLNKNCELKITDFGLARMMPQTSQSALEQNSHDGLSMMTEYVVTRWYRPPELMLAPNGSYDGAVDMWSVGCILGELISRKPLFPGTDFMDQLTRVFQVLPVPEPKDQGYTLEKGALKFLSSLPPPAPRALEDKVGETAGPQALDLLRRLLCLNPKRRISANDALAHPFFEGIRHEWGDITPLHLPHSLAVAFETQSMSLATLRQCISDEVLTFVDRTTTHQPEPQESDFQATKTAKAGAPKGPTVDSNDAPSVLANDYPSGSGFTLLGCDFNVPAKYKPLRGLGGGSDGLVCAATDMETNKNIAIKKITSMAGDEWDAKRTLRELRLMRYFGTHPHIASLQNLSTCIEKNELYLMMDLADTDLHRLIRSKTRLEEPHIMAIMYQLLCGAQTLHENGVVHCNLKPGTILVSKNCDVKITDLSFSRYMPPCTNRENTIASPTSNQDGPQPQRTVDKTQSLITGYVPPEVMLAPSGTYNAAFDMWSIGCIFGELLNRRPMFPKGDFLDQLSRVFSVLSMPPRNKLGYEVEGDALVFLENVPPCSPSALDKLFHCASPEAVHLLRRLLCVNPARRISAKQALAHPYFRTVRAQLGEPPVLRVQRVFELDYQDLPLAHLKALIQSEVKLLQNAGLRAPLGVSAPIEDAEQQPEDSDDDDTDDNDDAHVQEEDDLSATNRDVVTVRPDHYDAEAKQTKTTRIRENALVATGPEHDSELLVAKNDTHAEPAADECVQASSESGITKHRGQHLLQEDEEIVEVMISRKTQPAAVKLDTQNNDDDDKPHEIVNVAERSTGCRQPGISIAQASVAAAVPCKTSFTTNIPTVISCSLVRPKSADTTTYRSSTTSSESATSGISCCSQRNSCDDDKVSSVVFTTSNHRHHPNNNNGSDPIEHGGKWRHPRRSAMASTASSRLQRSTARIASAPSIHTLSNRQSGPVKTAPKAARLGTSRTSSSNSNQLSVHGRDLIDRGSVETDALRGPERVSSAVTAATRRQSSAAGTVRQTLSAPKDSLKVWIHRTHSEYFYDTLNKVASWKIPAKHQHLDSSIAGSSEPSSSQVPCGLRRIQVVPGKSSTSSNSALPLESDASRNGAVLSSKRSGSSITSTLPKEWVRCTDPKTGRLFFVNLVSNRSYAKLPSSITATMLNLGREAVIKRVTAETIHRKKGMVPGSCHQ